MLIKTSMMLSLFGKFSSINIENQEQSTKYANLVNAFLNEGFLIGIFNDVRLEIFPQNSSVPIQKNVLRPQLFSNDKEWGIDFFENRINIRWNAQKESDVLTLSDFIDKSIHYLEIVEKSYRIKFNRIALNCDEALMDFDETKAGDIYSSLTGIGLNIFSKENIKKWWFQFSSIVGGEPDIAKDINVIVGIQREDFDFPWKKQIDTILAHYDINTEVPKQDEKMISPDEKMAFLRKYEELHKELSKGIFGDGYV